MSLSDTTSLALMRDVPSSFPDCLKRTDPEEPIDLSLARRQHQRYRDILKTEGFRTHVLPPQDLLPDSCFVEDTMIALDSVLVITRPGAPSRREEAQETSAFLESVRPQVRIEAPGTVDGGDVFLLGKQLYVGTSSRTNADGIAQLTSIASHHGIKVTAIALHGCLHLRSAVSPLDDETVLPVDNDRLDGGSGADTVRGGDGSDTILDDVSEIDESFGFFAEWVDGV